jgi:hypothetical protein
MDALIERLKERDPGGRRGRGVQARADAARAELEAKNRAVIHELESLARRRSASAFAPVHGGVQTFPILHGKPVSAEQFDVLDDSTKRALTESEHKLTREVEKAAQLVRAQSARFEAAREAAFSKAASTRHRRDDEGGDPRRWRRWARPCVRVGRRACTRRSSTTGRISSSGRRRRAGEALARRADDPEHATRLNRFKVNLLVTHEPGLPAPVVYDTNPTYPSLFGYLERRARFGAL